jgi:UrcA family protein
MRRVCAALFADPTIRSNSMSYPRIAIALTAFTFACSLPIAAADPSAPPSLVVKYDDLDLSTEKDAKTLYARLRMAARQACAAHDGRDLRRRALWRQCYDDALSGAVVKVNRDTVSALHQRARVDGAS